MQTTYKNIILLGTSIPFILTFWIYLEISKAGYLISQAKNPNTSIEKGLNDAEKDFLLGNAHFKMIGQYTPEVSLSELANTFKKFKPPLIWTCGINNLENGSLNLSTYEYNEYYVTAYNIRLKRLLVQSIKSTPI